MYIVMSEAFAIFRVDGMGEERGEREDGHSITWV